MAERKPRIASPKLLPKSPTLRAAAAIARQIFIVHGHDPAARDQLELALHRLGLEPFVLMNTSGGGKTIIEALEGKIGRDYSSDFGIVLMTPDDLGYAKKDGPDRQAVGGIHMSPSRGRVETISHLIVR
jgi:predicted nucleotide-binding protein